MRTLPRTPSTMRTRSGTSSRGGMKSITRTAPPSVSQVVSRIERVVAVAARPACRRPAGASSQRPLLRVAEQRREAGAGVEARESRASRSSRRGRPAPPCASRRSARSPRFATSQPQRLSISSPNGGQRFFTARLNASSYSSPASSSSVRLKRSRMSASASVAVSTKST